MDLFKKLTAKLKMGEEGFTLPEVMIGAAITSVIALAIVSTAKHQANNSAASQAENEISQASAQILNIINSPAGCNANFRNGDHAYIGLGVDQPYSFGIYRCISVAAGSCSAGTASGSNVALTFPLVTSTFDSSTTKLGGKSRLNSIKYTLRRTPGGYLALSPLTLNLTFEKKVGTVITKVEKTFTTSLLMDTDGVTVKGCTRNANSTTVY